MVRGMAGRRNRHECRSLGGLALKGLPDPVERAASRGLGAQQEVGSSQHASQNSSDVEPRGACAGARSGAAAIMALSRDGDSRYGRRRDQRAADRRSFPISTSAVSRNSPCPGRPPGAWRHGRAAAVAGARNPGHGQGSCRQTTHVCFHVLPTVRRYGSSRSPSTSRGSQAREDPPRHWHQTHLGVLDRTVSVLAGHARGEAPSSRPGQLLLGPLRHIARGRGTSKAE